MQVRVLYFGLLKDVAGTAERVVQLAEGASAQDLLDLCRAGTSKQSEVWTRLAVAVNQEYASRSRVLIDGDEVALLPPVSGGGPCA